MHTSIVKQLGVAASPTTITPQLVDRSLEHLDGKTNNILVKVYRFIFPADFILLDFEAAKDVHIILDRPFLVKEDVIIDVKTGDLSMRVHEENMAFKILNATNSIDEDLDSCSPISMFHHLVANHVLLNSENDS
ncbi:uncharacterized protein LOC133289083 [Gastrolobium bilobum]|uniref:uncharacterized protein LOC133289083 n=1 Tax=Gastrolobium bilobum TaxID=150636 RepID=UPI002AB041E9|nr:uncharacterized protein LOC133289083 [Gastrolobium bilobum]